MTSCISCGKKEIQDYTLDEIFNCNSCIEKSTPSIKSVTFTETIYENEPYNNKTYYNNKTNSNISQDNFNALITQFNFLKLQIQEKDHLIRQLITILKDKNDYNNHNLKMSTSSPILKNSITTPSSIHFNSLHESDSSSMKSTYIIKDEFCASTAATNINQQLKDVRMKYHNDYLNKNSIYSGK